MREGGGHNCPTHDKSCLQPKASPPHDFPIEEVGQAPRPRAKHPTPTFISTLTSPLRREWNEKEEEEKENEERGGGFVDHPPPHFSP